MGNVIGYVLGAEAIAFCVIALIVVHWGKKLDQHLVTNHPKFFEDNLYAPFWAGDWGVVKQHLRALKNTYWGLMPDEASSFYQSQLRRYAKYALFCLMLFFITLIITVAVFLGVRASSS